jgi:hypothetical protein
VNWRNRAQFVGLAAVMMRRILVNYARDGAASKRGGDVQKVPPSDADEPGTPQRRHDDRDRCDALKDLGRS